MNATNQGRRQEIGLTSLLLAAGVGGTAVAVISANPVLTFTSMVVLVALWMGATEAPYRIIIAVYLSYQWLQASMKVWMADILGMDLSEPAVLTLCARCESKFFEVNDSTVHAAFLSLAAILMVAIGSRLFEPRLKDFSPKLSGLSPRRLFAGYMILLAVDRLSGPFIGGGLAQFFIAIGSLKFAFVVLLAYFWIVHRRGLLQLVGTVIIELMFGFSGYFADFKTVFIIAALAFLTVGQIHWRRARSLLIVCMAGALVLGSIWIVIRPTYRTALSGGQRAQIVTIDFGARLSTLQELVNGIDLAQLRSGFVGMASRIAYIDVFSQVLQQVPQATPHTDGQLWEEAISVVLEPRILFPNKAVLPSDSVRTSRYSGRLYASDAEGTSVSIGYVGDSYIDFGILGVLAIPFMLGTMYAFIARNLVKTGEAVDLTFALAVLIVVLRPVMLLEVSNVKLLPGQLYLWLIGFIAIKYAWPNLRVAFCVPADSKPLVVPAERLGRN